MAGKWLTTIEPQDVPTDQVGDKYSEVIRWVSELLDNEAYLSDDQSRFVWETHNRLEATGEATKLTDKQYKWLRGLYERLEERLTNPRSNRRRRR